MQLFYDKFFTFLRKYWMTNNGSFYLSKYITDIKFYSFPDYFIGKQFPLR